MPEMGKMTTIRVSETTLKDFNSEGVKGETSDQLLIRLLKGPGLPAEVRVMAENDLIVGFCEGLDTRGKRERDIIRSFPSPVFIRIDDPQPGDVEWAKLVLQYYLTPEAENYKPRPNMKFVHFDEKGQMEG